MIIELPDSAYTKDRLWGSIQFEHLRASLNESHEHVYINFIKDVTKLNKALNKSSVYSRSHILHAQLTGVIDDKRIYDFFLSNPEYVKDYAVLIAASPEKFQGDDTYLYNHWCTIDTENYYYPEQRLEIYKLLTQYEPFKTTMLQSMVENMNMLFYNTASYRTSWYNRTTTLWHLTSRICAILSKCKTMLKNIQNALPEELIILSEDRAIEYFKDPTNTISFLKRYPLGFIYLLQENIDALLAIDITSDIFAPIQYSEFLKTFCEFEKMKYAFNIQTADSTPTEYVIDMLKDAQKYGSKSPYSIDSSFNHIAYKIAQYKCTYYDASNNDVIMDKQSTDVPICLAYDDYLDRGMTTITINGVTINVPTSYWQKTSFMQKYTIPVTLCFAKPPDKIFYNMRQ